MEMETTATPASEVDVIDTADHQQDNQEVTQEAKPEGWDQVDLTPEQQKRFNRVYGQVKNLERGLSDKDQLLKQQFDLINELKQGQTQIVSHIQNNDYERAEAQLKAQINNAYQSGDMDAFTDANTRLTEIRMERKAAERAPRTETQQQVQPSQDYVEINSIDEAVDYGVISKPEAAFYSSWQAQTDPDGEPLRPWTNKNHPYFRMAELEGQAVFNNPQYARLPLSAKLAEVDRRMGIMNTKPQQTVLPGGNLTPRNRPSTIKLSPFQEQLAVKTKFAGPGKSSADHMEAYRKQIQETKGARK